MKNDAHYLGTFNTISEAWKLYPNGGGFGDYIIVDGETIKWNEYSRSWGEQTESSGTQRPDETVKGNMDVEGSVKVRDDLAIGEYVPKQVGAGIDKHGNADVRTLTTDKLWVKYNGEHITLAKYIKLFKTELPPDWEEYSKAILFDDMRIMVFDPNTNEKYYTTIKAIKDVIGTSSGSGGESGVSIEIIRSDDKEATLTDNNVFSSLRTMVEIAKVANEKLSRINPDEAQGIIKFIQGLITKSIISPNYMPSMLGEGFSIDEYGRAVLESLEIRTSLTVPELRFNRVSIYTGIRWDTFGGGIIENVEIDTDDLGKELQSGIITLRLEDGDIGAIDVDDMCMGIYHNFGSGNDTVTEDQQNGNFRFKGFSTSYFRVTEILESDNSRFRYVLRGKSDRWQQQHHPSQFMHFAAYSNPTNKDRQSSTYTTTSYTIRLKNMTTWEYGNNNIYEISGKLDGFKIGDTILQGEGQAFGNAYIWGTLQQVYNDPVRMEIEHNGDGFLAFGETMDITCKVFQGWKDITDTVDVWRVTRESGNQNDDNAWNILQYQFNGQITLRHTQTNSDLGKGLSTLFRFEAKAGEITSILYLTF